MSLKLGGLLTAPGSSNQISSGTAKPATKPVGNEKYTGGTLSIPVVPGETPQKMMNRGLYEHAKKAGLDTVPLEDGGKSAARKFADHWTVSAMAVRDTKGEFKTRSPKELATLIAHTKTVSVVLDQKNADILADLNARLDAQRAESIPVDSSVQMTATERAAALKAKASVNGANSAAITAKPLATLGSVDASGGKVKNAEDAFKEHLKQNYNPNNRVWGDKMNEVLAQAKQDGITVDNFELVTDEFGKERATFTVSGENKAKLDKLFNDALGETIKGEKGSDEGQREGLRMGLDIPITLINATIKAGQGVANIPSDLEDLGRAARKPGSWATAKIGGLPELDAQIPKLPDSAPLGAKITPEVDLSGYEIPNQSDLFNKDINGKVNPNGQTLGKTAATVTAMVIPLPVNQTAEVIVDAVAQTGANVARRIGKVGQEAAEGMRTFGQPEFAAVNGAPTRAVPVSSRTPLDTLHDPMEITKGEFDVLRGKSPTSSIHMQVNFFFVQNAFCINYFVRVEHWRLLNS